jgi:hypothetical protein
VLGRLTNALNHLQPVGPRCGGDIRFCRARRLGGDNETGASRLWRLDEVWASVERNAATDTSGKDGANVSGAHR